MCIRDRLYEDLTVDIPPGAIVGIIGPNGAGKTTLFRMIVGQEVPDDGTLTVGSTVKLAYVDQSRDDLAPNKSVWEEISDCLLYTSDAADERSSVDLGGRRIIKKKKKEHIESIADVTNQNK